MRSAREAIDELRASAQRCVGVKRVPLVKAGGRVLAKPIVSELDVPPADNSAMDGYALRFDEWPGKTAPMPVSQRITAGSAPAPLEPGTAARIFTGAEIPDGADTVVIQEHTQASEEAVLLTRLPDRCANIRPQGQDIARGREVVHPGCRLRPQELGLLASIGIERVPVFERLRVAIVSTGDELREPGEQLAPGQIYNSNRYLLRGLLESWGFKVVDLGIAKDTPDAIAAVFEAAAERAHVVLSTGGVSVGEEDHVRAVIERLGALALWKIAMKPGKPLAFGRIGETPFIGLPGNPSSALVTALVVARPFLFDCQGRSDVSWRPLEIPAAFSKRGGPREEFLRVRRADGRLERYPNQSSGVLLSASWGDGLAVQAPGRDIEAGDVVPFLAYADLL
ncbi:MAG: gephyrin-like molybdotransferase Glp [Pseudomonadota bacterium]